MRFPSADSTKSIASAPNRYNPLRDATPDWQNLDNSA